MSDAYQGGGVGGQGTAGVTDIVTQLQGIIRQIQLGNTQLASIVSALLGVQLQSYTVATLPSSPAVGNMAVVTDGAAAQAWAATITGGGSTRYIVWWNGSNWVVMGR